MIQLEGFKEFTDQIIKLGDSQKKTVVAAIMRKNLQPVASAIRTLAPERKSDRTIKRYRKDGSVSTESTGGNLRRSIGIKTFTGRGTVSAYAGIMNKKNEQQL